MRCHSVRVPQNHVLTLVADLGQGKLRLIPGAYILSVHRVQLFTRTVPTFSSIYLTGPNDSHDGLEQPRQQVERTLPACASSLIPLLHLTKIRPHGSRRLCSSATLLRAHFFWLPKIGRWVRTEPTKPRAGSATHSPSTASPRVHPLSHA